MKTWQEQEDERVARIARLAEDARMQDLYARLRWQYGAQRAGEIITGKDPADIADRRAWAACGGVVVKS